MLKHLGSSLVASLTILVFTAIGGVVSARYLLPVGKGELTAITLWPTFFATIAGLGLAEAVTFHTARTRHRSREVLSTALALTCASAVAFVAVGWVLLPHILGHYNEDTIRTARWFLFFVPVSISTTMVMGVMQGNLQLGAYNLFRALVHILTVAGMLLLVLAGHAGVWGFALAGLVAELVTLAAATLMACRSGWIGWPRTDAVRSLLGFGLQSQVGTLASVVNLRLDQMAMSAFLSAPMLGVYAVAVTIAGVANIGPVAVGAVAFPRISGEHRAEARLRQWGQLLRISVLLQIALTAALWWATPLIVRICFGSSFSASTMPARILLIASLPLGINLMLATGFRACNRPMTPSTAELISIAATAGGLWLLLARYGPEGAAWASLLAYSVTCSYLLVQVRAQLHYSPLALFIPHRDDWLHGRAFVLRQMLRFVQPLG